jgi:hypothetical protein
MVLICKSDLIMIRRVALLVIVIMIKLDQGCCCNRGLTPDRRMVLGQRIEWGIWESAVKRPRVVILIVEIRSGL